MSNVRIWWTWLWMRTLARRAHLALSLRVTIAALLAFTVSNLLSLRLPLWTVLTAIILTQANFGRSVKATLDYFVGTVGGAIYAGAVSVLVPHNNELALAGVLALAVAPLALLGAINPSFGSAPFTGALVLLVPGLAHVGPIESAVDRVLEVAIGGNHRRGGVASRGAGARPFVRDRGGGSDARSDGPIPSELVRRVPRACRPGGVRPSPGRRRPRGGRG